MIDFRRLFKAVSIVTICLIIIGLFVFGIYYWPIKTFGVLSLIFSVFGLYKSLD